MLPEIHIRPDASMGDKARQMLGDELGGKALAAAVNKTIAKVNTQVMRDMTQASGLPLKTVRRRVFLKRAKADNGSASVTIGSKPYQAIEFGAVDNRPAGVSVAKPAAARWPKAFIATGPKVGRRVFQRQDDHGYYDSKEQRRHLKSVTHLTPSDIFEQYGKVEKYQAMVDADLGAQIDNQIDRFLATL